MLVVACQETCSSSSSLLKERIAFTTLVIVVLLPLEVEAFEASKDSVLLAFNYIRHAFLNFFTMSTNGLLSHHTLSAVTHISLCKLLVLI